MSTKATSIAFLHRIHAEGIGWDTEVEMTRCVALKSPAYLSTMKIAVHHLKSTAPSLDERMDAITYFFRHRMNELN